MNRTLLAATAASLFSFSTLAAADSLTGPYAGASAVIAETMNIDVKEDDGGTESYGASDNLSSANLIVGYNMVLESGMFVGLEANYNLTGIDKNIVDTDQEKTDFSKESSYGVRGKLGAALTDRIALYGIAGYQEAEWEADSDGKTDNDHTGISYGIGATYALNDNWLLTGEALQTNYGEEDYGSDEAEVDETQFSVGLAYRFNL